MAILNYTTTISVDKTIGEIQGILSQNGARKIVTDYDEKARPIAITFTLFLSEVPVFYNLPCNYHGVLKAMEFDKKVARNKCTIDQALRVAWRIIKDWIEAQMAITKSQQAQMAEVFLPYAVMKNGNTLFKEIQNGNLKLLD